MKMAKPGSRAMADFEGLVPHGPRITRRLVFGNPAAFVNGNMFFGVFADDVFVRLSDADRSELMQIDGSRPFEPIEGRPMAGYVVLPPPVLQRRPEAARWVERAREWAEGLPPKLPKERAAGRSGPGADRRPGASGGRRR